MNVSRNKIININTMNMLRNLNSTQVFNINFMRLAYFLQYCTLQSLTYTYIQLYS